MTVMGRYRVRFHWTGLAIAWTAVVVTVLLVLMISHAR